MLKSFLSLWLKFPCPLCQRVAESTFCKSCLKKLKNYQLSNPQKNWRGNFPVFVWGKYDGELTRAIAKLKYENKPEIATILGNWLGTSWLENCPSIAQKPLVLPIPLHSTKQKSRGFNQAELIAQGFCQITKYPLASPELIRIKNTSAMFGLNSQERQNNIKNAFRVSQKWQKTPPKAPVLLLDDIYTRGTTVKEATKILRKYHIKVLGAIAVARPLKIN